MAKPKIIEAAGVAGRSLGDAMETAMAAAVTDAYASGIYDPKKIKALMMEARAKAKAEYRARG